MTRKLFQTLLISFLLIGTTHATDANRVAATLETLRQSLNEHDYAQLEPLLADDFSYQGTDARTSQMIMQQVVAGYANELSAIDIMSISETDAVWVVAVALVSDTETDQRTIRLNQDFHLLQADIADIQLGGHGATAPPAESVSEVLPATTTFPFTLAKNLIVVQAEINGVFGNYLVDTGAQSVVLNRPHFADGDVETVTIDHAIPGGVNGAVQNVKGAANLELKWGAIEIAGLRGIVMDLSHLEKSIGVEVAGLIGYNVLERFQVQFDYAAGELTLYSLDDDAQPLAQNDLGEATIVAEFNMVGHIPVFDVEIAGFDLRMGLDSGAGEAMLFERWQATLDGQYEFVERTELRGGDKGVQMGDVVRIADMQVQELEYSDLLFRFNDIAAFANDDNAVPMDGLLGYEFLQARPTAINFRAREVRVW